MIIDNAKCAIVKACRHDPLVQRGYAECAEGYGFKIDACPPQDPQKKGVVEAGVKYVKTNFLPTRTFRDLADLNAQVRQWVMLEAGTRVHGTTREHPLVVFELERPLLRRLPAVAPDLGSWHRVVLHRDCHVQFDRAYYSAPFTLVGKTLWARASDTVVALYEDSPAPVHPPARATSGPAHDAGRPPATPRRATSSSVTAAGATPRRAASARTAPNSWRVCWATASPSGCVRPRPCWP